MAQDPHGHRTIGLLGATGVGVGAIVGGGILALAGVAFATTGPSAIVAFAANGLIALLTALSFAEMSSAFPESGGTYTFAKKVLSVESAFAVGWVVWFASIVAAVLYGLGFGYFAAVVLSHVWKAAFNSPSDWITGRAVVAGLAIGATLIYTLMLARKGGGGGSWENIGKLIVFAVLIAGGLWAVTGRSVGQLQASLTPFFSAGAIGLFQAMGFTFIALQGFDLIAAVGGEIREPARTIPRAMLISLGIALAIYLPLLFVLSTVGVESGSSIKTAAANNPETIVAVAAQNYLGAFGYWLVIVAAVLSMLSALQANLFAASRVALAMSRDRTLPTALSRLNERRGTPVPAILCTALIVATIIAVVPNVAAAGAASSLIFLVTFALAHWISILVRRRSRQVSSTFRAPLFPLIPVVGGLACIVLAVYQGVSVLSAGLIAAAWLAVGGVLFLALFARRARVVDASTEAFDPEVVRLRGRNPLVLVPIANPANAASMVAVAQALAPRDVGRVLLLSVVEAREGWQPREDSQPLTRVQDVLGKALAASVEADFYPEALTTIAGDPWQEIARVAKTHRCESLLLGLSRLEEETVDTPLDVLMSQTDSDVVVLRAPQDWKPADVRRILVPIGGRGGHDRLRARLLGSLFRTGERIVTFLRVMAENTAEKDERRARAELLQLGRDEVRGNFEVEIVLSDRVANAVAEQAAQSDLVVLGVQRLARSRKSFGSLTLQVARQTTCPLIMISRRG